jgi:leucyl aminopeptidase
MALEFTLRREHPAEIDVDCVVVGIFDDRQLSEAAAAIDGRSQGRLLKLVESGDLSGKAGRSAMLLGVEGVRAPRVLVVGLGAQERFDVAAFVKAAGEVGRALRTGPVRSVYDTLCEIAVPGRDRAWAVRQCALAADFQAYRYTATKKGNGNGGLAKVVLPGADGEREALRQAEGIAAGVALARELGNLPPNICTPAYLAERALAIAAEHPGVSCEVLETAQMEALGMGALLGVARGSANAPRLIVLQWAGGGDARPHVLVGKGITFDTGGISLKPGPGMEEMKFDMCGAAGVLGTFLAAVRLKLPLNLVAIVPAVENMPDGNAYRPSDIVTTMSGKTVEVLNTDAEGRLILCDALTYAQRFEPATLIDVATLTGACVVALGKHAHGLMSRDEDLAQELLAAGNAVHDRAWPLPIWDDYQPLLDSGFADVANIGGKWAGAITAGCFLARFTEGQRWAHLDIAGTAWDEGRKGLATGRPVGLLVQWLLDRAR